MNRIACAHIRSGGLGKILEVRRGELHRSDRIAQVPFPEEPIPNGLDWNMWLNQVAWRAYNHRWMEDRYAGRTWRRRDDELGPMDWTRFNGRWAWMAPGR